MSYISINYYIMVIILFSLYYIFPKRFCWYVLLFGSIVFYFRLTTNLGQLLVWGLMVVFNFWSGLLIHKVNKSQKILWGG